ncbi:hypothetical protein EMPG_16827 [Blastomyces silverae]|uniref:Uncharacterized protein n=1 Tax=Blastomyces silverae TaxID=2060906 RepID=A0A0H1B9C4_9EURO|nr:hypothetical protein EMPG_16827 [Blastomyces silverae]
MGQPIRTGDTPPSSGCSVQANCDSSDRSEGQRSTPEGGHYWSIPSLPQTLRREEGAEDEREPSGSISPQEIQAPHADGPAPARTDRTRGPGTTTTGTRHPPPWYSFDDSYVDARPNESQDNRGRNEREPESPRPRPTDTRTNQVNGSPDSTRPNPSEGSLEGSVPNTPQREGHGQGNGNTPNGEIDDNYIWEEPFIPSGIPTPQSERQGGLGGTPNNQINGNGSVNSVSSDENSSDDGESNPGPESHVSAASH